VSATGSSFDIAPLVKALADRYRVERELGAGGMATVFLAQDLKHEREVAIKVLQPELGAALGADRFHAEIRITARLQHPHILPLIDSGEAGGLLYYVVPFTLSLVILGVRELILATRGSRPPPEHLPSIAPTEISSPSDTRAEKTEAHQ